MGCLLAGHWWRATADPRAWWEMATDMGEPLPRQPKVLATVVAQLEVFMVGRVAGLGLEEDGVLGVGLVGGVDLILEELVEGSEVFGDLVGNVGRDVFEGQSTPDPQKTPDAPLNFRPCPTPISANSDASPTNSDASPANSDGPLNNFDAFPAATNTYPGSPEPREPPPLFPIFATHHQLNTLVPLTHSGVSQQPRGDPHSPMIPSTSAWPDPQLQPTPAHSVELRQAPPPQPTYPEVLR
ncbi:hypothetical protein E4T56_gene11055 [Termitomyces sp. T112]|nr:hypothetical protein E4T56_gene11055 [Termitomyces sp. T112]